MPAAAFELKFEAFIRFLNCFKYIYYFWIFGFSNFSIVLTHLNLFKEIMEIEF